MIRRADFTGLCKECKDGNNPREEMKKQFLMILSKVLSKRVGKRLHSLQILAKVTLELWVRCSIECKGQQRNG
jgi:hypothetical protein